MVLKQLQELVARLGQAPLREDQMDRVVPEEWVVFGKLLQAEAEAEDITVVAEAEMTDAVQVRTAEAAVAADQVWFPVEQDAPQVLIMVQVILPSLIQPGH